jgi:aldose 1-epimerase
MTPLSGTAHVLRFGDAEATIAGVGASLRSYTHAGRDLVVPFAADEVRPAYRGATLAPWPNRVVDGRYAFAGVEHRLALTEPERAHALHGLVVWSEFDAVDKKAGSVTLVTTVEAQTGYPWRLQVETTYVLDAAGLTQTVRARNDSATEAPWGTGPHPYLVGGAGRLDEWMLHLPASQVLLTTPDRLSPTELADVDVDAARFDFRTSRPIGAVEIDHAFTDLARDDDGRATVEVRGTDGAGVAMTWGTACGWVQVHTADLPAGPSAPGHRIGLAVEPMTCAPDAFNDARYPFDAGLQTIAAGEWSAPASWTIRPI